MLSGLFDLCVFAGYSLGCFSLGAWCAAVVLNPKKHDAGR